MNKPVKPGVNVLLVLLTVLITAISACTTGNRPNLESMSFSKEPLLGKLIWYDLITEDLDKTEAFYSDLFGWDFDNATAQDGRDYRLASLGGVYVAGIVAAGAHDDGKNYSRWLPYMSVANVDKALSMNVAAGGSVAASARDVGIGRVAAIVDPQGAVIGLASSSIGDPDDTTTAAAPGRPVWTELLADDTQAAAEFYASLANYDARSVQRRGGNYVVLSSNGADRAGIFENPAEGKHVPVWITAFGVTDPVTAANTAEALGGRIILPASPDLRGGTIAVITDPTGAILVLQTWSKNGAEL